MSGFGRKTANESSDLKTTAEDAENNQVVIEDASQQQGFRETTVRFDAPSKDGKLTNGSKKTSSKASSTKAKGSSVVEEDKERIRKKKQSFMKYSVRTEVMKSASVEEALEGAAAASASLVVDAVVKPPVDVKRGAETWKRFKEMKKKNKNPAAAKKVINDLENCDFLAEFTVFT